MPQAPPTTDLAAAPAAPAAPVAAVPGAPPGEGVGFGPVGGTVGLGDAVSATRYGSALADNAISVSDELGGIMYTIAATTTQILVTLSAAVTLAGTIKVTVFYTVE